MPDRDPFANLERMRREMDELFGDVLRRGGPTHGRPGRWPAVDVAYADDPPRAIVTAELAGVDPDDIGLEIEGRTLVLSGRRRPAPGHQCEVYQCVEIERGTFRRVIELGADVRAEDASAHYEDGMLRIQVPLAPPRSRSRDVPIDTPDSA